MDKIKNNPWLIIVCYLIFTALCLGAVELGLYLMNYKSDIIFFIGFCIILSSLLFAPYWTVIVILKLIELILNHLKKEKDENAS